jgi:predicted SAM-dependent methyltransferase
MSLKSKSLLLGSGGQESEGFLNTDIDMFPNVDMQLDATKFPYPFDDNYFESVYNSHMIEHISRDVVPDMIKEWYRILQPKGECVIDAPDIEGGIVMYIEGKQKEALELIYGNTERDTQAHKWGWTYRTLAPLFVNAGFSDVHEEESTDYHLTQFNIPTFRLRAIK